MTKEVIKYLKEKDDMIDILHQELFIMRNDYTYQNKLLKRIKKYILQNCTIIHDEINNIDKIGLVDGGELLKMIEEEYNE